MEKEEGKKLEDGGELHDIRLAANDVHRNHRSRQNVSPDPGLAPLQAVTSVCILHAWTSLSFLGLLDSFSLYLNPSNISKDRAEVWRVCFRICLYKYRDSIFQLFTTFLLVPIHPRIESFLLATATGGTLPIRSCSHNANSFRLWWRIRHLMEIFNGR